MAAFDANSFCKTTGFSMFGAIASIASAAHDRAQAIADAEATDEALATWRLHFIRQESDIASLLELVDTMKIALVTRDRTIAALRREIASAEAIVSDFLDSQGR